MFTLASKAQHEERVYAHTQHQFAYYFAASLRLCVVMDLEAGFEHVSWRVFEYQETPPPAVQTNELPDEVDDIITKHIIQFQHIHLI